MAARMGRAIPTAITEEPELASELWFYMYVFFMLDADRGSEINSQIPWSSIQLYAISHGLDEDATFTLQQHIRALDQVAVEYRVKKSKTKGVKNGNPKGTGKAPQKNR